MGCLSLTYQEQRSSLQIIYKNDTPRSRRHITSQVAGAELWSVPSSNRDEMRFNRSRCCKHKSAALPAA